LSSRPSSRQGAMEQDTKTATATSHSSPITSSLTTVHLGVQRALEDQLSHLSQEITPMNAINSISVPKLGPPESATQTPTHLLHPPESADSTESLATPSQQSLVLEHQTVSLSFIFHLRMMSLKQSKTPSGNYLLPSPQRSEGIFKKAHDISIVGSNFIDNANGSGEACSLRVTTFSTVNYVTVSYVDE
jgi:hypothetical protein